MPFPINSLSGESGRLRHSNSQIPERAYRDGSRVPGSSASERTNMRTLPRRAGGNSAKEIRSQRQADWQAKGLAGSSPRGFTGSYEALAGSESRKVPGASAEVGEEPGPREAPRQLKEHTEASTRQDRRAQSGTLYGLRSAIPSVRHAVRSPRCDDQAVQHRIRQFSDVGSGLEGDRQVRSGVRQLPHGTDPRAYLRRGLSPELISIEVA